jgi:hypothetical protein
MQPRVPECSPVNSPGLFGVPNPAGRSVRDGPDGVSLAFPTVPLVIDVGARPADRDVLLTRLTEAGFTHGARIFHASPSVESESEPESESKSGPDIQSATVWLALEKAVTYALGHSGELALIIAADDVEDIDVDLKRRLIEVSNSTRCGRHVLKPGLSGVLYLGARARTFPAGVAAAVTSDMVEGAYDGNGAGSCCYNVWNAPQLDCLSGLYRHAALRALAGWMASNRDRRDRPLCEAAQHLADLGHVTRAAWPGLRAWRSTEPALAAAAVDSSVRQLGVVNRCLQAYGN